MTTQDAAQFLMSWDKILILTHIRPDGPFFAITCLASSTPCLAAPSPISLRFLYILISSFPEAI